MWLLEVEVKEVERIVIIRLEVKEDVSDSEVVGVIGGKKYSLQR